MQGGTLVSSIAGGREEKERLANNDKSYYVDESGGYCVLLPDVLRETRDEEGVWVRR